MTDTDQRQPLVDRNQLLQLAVDHLRVFTPVKERERETETERETERGGGGGGASKETYQARLERDLQDPERHLQDPERDLQDSERDLQDPGADRRRSHSEVEQQVRGRVKLSMGK